MTKTYVAKILLITTLLLSLQACLPGSDGNGALPRIEVTNAINGTSVMTEDAMIGLSGTATSDSPIVSVTWENSRGGSGTMQGLEDWYSGNISLVVGSNTITITAIDDNGNTNNRDIQVERTMPGSGSGDDDAVATVADPVLMYSYNRDLKNSAPANGARIDPKLVYLFVIPSTEWRQRGINHISYYCCVDSNNTQDGPSSPPEMAVSFEPWSMAMDMSPYSDGERWKLGIEASLDDGSTSVPADFLFTVKGNGSGANTVPSITGRPEKVATVGIKYQFRPSATDPDADTLGFSVSRLPSWAKFDPLTGRIWGTPQSPDVGMYTNIKIAVTDGKSSSSIAPFDIEVTENSGANAGSSSIPRINSFQALPSAITKGQTSTLTWNVKDATNISINQGIGVVSGNSFIVSPQQTTTYKITAQNLSGQSTSKLTVAVLSGSNDWNVSHFPPTLKNPKIIDVSNHPTTFLAARDIHCGGLVRKIFLNDSDDAIVYMSGNRALRYPLQITGGRNVRVVGLQFAMETQPGCGIGELPNKPAAQFPNANIHPRIPGAMVLRLEQSHSSFVEGLNIDVRGHQADCLVIRNPDSLANSQAQRQRDVTIQNTYCSGVEGMGQTDIGDGVHGDFLQNQGNDVMRNLVFENVSMRTSQNGIVIHGGGDAGGKGTVNLIVRRYDYTWDPRYVGDDNYERFGLALAGKVGPSWSLDNIRIDDFRDNGDYMNIDGQRYGATKSKNVLAHPEIRSGLPPEGAFALPERTGVNYVSPHGDVPGG